METGWEPEGFHQPGKKIGIMAIDVLTRMREAIGGARMKELGAWLGVNQSALIEYDVTPGLPVVYGCLRREPSQSIWDPDREGEKYW